MKYLPRHRHVLEKSLERSSLKICFKESSVLGVNLVFIYDLFSQETAFLIGSTSPLMCLLSLDANKREVYLLLSAVPTISYNVSYFINCERSDLRICKVHQFGLGCVKNCAR